MAAKPRFDIKKSFDNGAVANSLILKDFADSVLFLKDEGSVSNWKQDTLYAADSAVYYKKNFYALVTANTPFCSTVQPDKDTKNWCKIGSGEDDDWIINGNCMYANTSVLKVGIGTATPDATLDVSRKGKGQFLVEPNAENPKISLINLDATCDKNKVEIIATTQTIDLYNDAPNGLRLMQADKVDVKEGTPVEIMRITASDSNAPRVGIGTPEPQAHLHIEEKGKGYVKINGGEAGTMPSVKVGNLAQPCKVNFIKMTIGETEAAFVTDAHGGYQFKQKSAEKEETLVTISQEGNVGIGTTTPLAALEIASCNEMEGNIKSGFCNNYPFLQLLNYRSAAADGNNYSQFSTDDKWSILMSDAEGFAFKKGRILAKKEQIANVKEGSTLMRIYNEGKVTIGKNRHKDNFELDVDGNIRACSLYLDTDRPNMEEDSICDLENVLDKVCDLRPITFKWNNKTQCFGEPTRIGLIADEVKPLFPEVVKENKDCNADTIAYQNLVPVLIKAIQEQQGMINAQAEIIKDLKCKVEELEDRVCKLENE